MTETSNKSAARLLAEAEQIIWRRLDNWPDELLPSELMALMAGDSHPREFQTWRRLILKAIEAKSLTCAAPDRLFIDRHQCAAWLRSIEKEPSELVRAWLGDT